jgi:hypothetical protein
MSNTNEVDGKNILANTELTEKPSHYFKRNSIHFTHCARFIRPDLMTESSGCHSPIINYDRQFFCYDVIILTTSI